MSCEGVSGSDFSGHFVSEQKEYFMWLWRLEVPEQAGTYCMGMDEARAAD